MALDLERVQQEARGANLYEIYVNHTSRVVSFAPNDDVSSLTRLNVYWTTGTVGTCLDHPRQGKTQLFRRNVSSMLLRELMRDPRLHTGTGYHRRAPQRETCSICLDKTAHVPLTCGHNTLCAGCADQLPKQNGRVSCPLCRTSSILPDDLAAPKEEEAEALAQVARLREEARVLAEQTTEAEAVLAACRQRREAEERRRAEEARRAEEEARQRAAAAEAERQRQRQEEARRAKEAERTARGSCYDLFLSSHRDIEDMFDKTVTRVATDGNGTVMLYDTGGWAYTSGLTKLLHNKLNGRSNRLPSPTYVAMGSQNRYYIEFADGKSEWVASDDAATEINKSSVASIAFGQTWESYFLVTKGGGWAYYDVPHGLEDVVNNKKNKRKTINCVSLGANGQWYISFTDGSSNWGGLSSASLAKIAKVRNRITFMDFGHYDEDEEEDELFLRYK